MDLNQALQPVRPLRQPASKTNFPPRMIEWDVDAEEHDDPNDDEDLANELKQSI